MAVILLLTSLCYLRTQTRSAWILNSSFHVLTATSIPVVDGDMTHINERFDPAERQPGVVHEPSEDTPLSRRVLAGKYFLLPCLLDTVVEYF